MEAARAIGVLTTPDGVVGEVVVGAAPFLSPGAFGVLALGMPALTLLVTDPGWQGTALGAAPGCVLASWIAILGVGGAVHVVANLIAPRLLAPGRSVLAGTATVGAAVTATSVGAMLVLLPRLEHLAPHLAEPGGHATPIARAIAVSLLYVAAARGHALLRGRAREAAERARESNEAALRARLDALQSQTHPHFLLNALNSVASLIPTDPALAESTLERLSGVLAYSLTSGTRSSSTLEEEVGAARDYLAVQEARFGARLRARVEVDPSLDSLPVPPMLLQPLVENAVLHGLAGRTEGGEVVIAARAHGGTAVITVADDGVGPGGSPRSGTRTGLRNLRERLALRYGDAGRLDVRARDGGGLVCEVRLPIESAP